MIRSDNLTAHNYILDCYRILAVLMVLSESSPKLCVNYFR